MYEITSVPWQAQLTTTHAITTAVLNWVRCWNCHQDYPEGCTHFCPTAVPTQRIFVVEVDGTARPVWQVDPAWTPHKAFLYA